MYDIHVHSTFSHDGKSTLDEYIKLIDNGYITGIGFAEHVDFMPECGGYRLFDYDSYMNAIRRYKNLGYYIFAGAEIDYARKVESEIKQSLKKQPYDYTICSVHMIDGLSVSTDENINRFADISAFHDILEKYFHEVSCSLNVDDFDVVGHPGIYKRYLDESFFNSQVLKNWIKEAEIELAGVCAESGKIVEVNTSGLSSICKSTFPGDEFLTEYYRQGGRRITIGSDSHSHMRVQSGFNEAAEMLKQIGFEYIFLPWDKNNPVKIR